MTSQKKVRKALKRPNAPGGYSIDPDGINVDAELGDIHRLLNLDQDAVRGGRLHKIVSEVRLALSHYSGMREFLDGGPRSANLEAEVRAIVAAANDLAKLLDEETSWLSKFFLDEELRDAGASEVRVEEIASVVGALAVAADGLLEGLCKVESRHARKKTALTATLQALEQVFDQYHSHPAERSKTDLKGYKQEFLEVAFRAIQVRVPEDVFRRHLP